MVLDKGTQERRISALRLHRVDHVVQVADAAARGGERSEEGVVPARATIVHRRQPLLRSRGQIIACLYIVRLNVKRLKRK